MSTSDESRCPECGEPVSQTAAYCMHCQADLNDGIGPDPDDESNAGVISQLTDALGIGSDEVGQPDPYEPTSVEEADGDGTPTDSQVTDQTQQAEPTQADQTQQAEPTQVDQTQTIDQQVTDQTQTIDQQVTDQTQTIDQQTTDQTQAIDQQTTDQTQTANTAAASRTPSADNTRLLDPDGVLDNALTILVGIGGGFLVGLIGLIALAGLTGSGLAIPFGLLAWLVSTVYIGRQRSVQGAIAKAGFATAIVLVMIPLWAVSPFGTANGGIVDRIGLFFSLLVAVAVPAGFAAGVGWVAAQFRPDESR